MREVYVGYGDAAGPGSLDDLVLELGGSLLAIPPLVESRRASSETILKAGWPDLDGHSRLLIVDSVCPPTEAPIKGRKRYILSLTLEAITARHFPAVKIFRYTWQDVPRLGS